MRRRKHLRRRRNLRRRVVRRHQVQKYAQELIEGAEQYAENAVDGEQRREVNRLINKIRKVAASRGRPEHIYAKLQRLAKKEGRIIKRVLKLKAKVNPKRCSCYKLKLMRIKMKKMAKKICDMRRDIAVYRNELKNQKEKRNILLSPCAIRCV
jgi:hypothetical protein